MRGIFSGRFNGATAIQPWKPSDANKWSPCSPMLQWGHGYSAVETLFKEIQQLPSVLLQWGHGYSAVETYWSIALSAVTSRASMGPRLFSRGNLAGERGAAESSAALQWGHGYSAVETFWCEQVDDSSHCFNGATAIQPWKQLPRISCRSGACSFNGATAIQPWKRRHETWMQRNPSSFNGATAIQPWKRSPPPRQAYLVQPASMGPRLFSRGNNLWDFEGRNMPRASMGPRLFSRGNNNRNQGSFFLIALQWGHGYSAVETNLGLYVPVHLNVRLQWGHGYSAVETATSGSGPFTHVMLQWGHGYSAVETREETCRVPWNSNGFNGATAIQPWKLYSGVICT